MVCTLLEGTYMYLGRPKQMLLLIGSGANMGKRWCCWEYARNDCNVPLIQHSASGLDWLFEEQDMWLRVKILMSSSMTSSSHYDHFN